jgi:hypothetical protein
MKVALKIGSAFNPATQTLLNENLQKTLKNVGRSPTSKNKGFLMLEQTLLILADLENPDPVIRPFR